MGWVLHSYPDNEKLVTALATEMGTLLSGALHERGRAALAVSGGSTPRSLFDALSAMDLGWSGVVVTLVDERWVAADHADANARLVRKHLLQGFAVDASFVGLKSADDNPFTAVREIDARLRAEVLPLDIAVLGMGEDGHTASFFPYASGLEHALSPLTEATCAGIHPPQAPHDRMTLTLNTLLNARHLMLHCVGPAKLAVLQTAMAPGAVTELPVRAVLHQNRLTLNIHHASAG